MAQTASGVFTVRLQASLAQMKTRAFHAADALVDLLVEAAMRVSYVAVKVGYPFIRSRSGWANPRARSITGLTYMYYLQRVVAPNIDKWLEKPQPLFPHAIQVQTINRCNAACQMCPYPYTIHLQPKQVMEDATYTRIVDECAGHPDLYEFVPMSKNEPLMDTKLEQRIAEFKAKAAPHQLVEVVTNGSALTPQRYEKLVASGVDLLTISFSAHSKASFDKIMQSLSWEGMRRNLESLAQKVGSQVNLMIRFVRQADNYDEFPAFRRYWQRKGFNVIEFSLNNRAGTLRNFAAMLPQAREYVIRKARLALGRRYLRVCPHMFSVMHVLENGDVPLCANDWESREIVGNVKEKSLFEIYNSPQFEQIREMMKQGRYEEIPLCKNCSYWQDWLKRPAGDSVVAAS